MNTFLKIKEESANVDAKSSQFLSRFFAFSILIFSIPFLSLRAQKTLFSSDFNSSEGASYTTTIGPIGTSVFQFQKSGGDFGARIHNGRLEITNNATAGPENNGWAFAYVNTTTAFNSPYNTTFDQNQGNLRWFLNMRQSNPDPSGFGTGFPYGNACAYVLGCTSPNVGNTGSGYALAFGESGSLDRMKLFSFTNGIQGPKTDVFTLIFNGTPDFGNEYFSFRGRYTPDGNWSNWSALLDGLAGFLDPTRTNGAGNGGNNGPALGTTSISLPYSGLYYQSGASYSGTAFLDNWSVLMEPSYPTPGALSYNQNFGTTDFSVPPSSFAIWGGVSGATTSTQAMAEASKPHLDVDLTSQYGPFVSEPAGGPYGMGGGVDARLAIATSSDPDKGLCQPVLGIRVDSGITKIKITYDQLVLFSGQRICGNALQYRRIYNNPTNWVTVPGSVLDLGAFPVLNTRYKKGLLLDIPNIGEQVFQFRWIYWRVNGSGSSNTSLGLDNVSVKIPVSNNFLDISSPTSAAGFQPAGTSNAVLQRIELACPAYSDATLVNALQLNTKGTYAASDISNIKVYYSTNNTWDIGDLLVASKTTGIGAGFHYLIFSSTPSIAPGSTGYLFVTADIASGATAGNTIFADEVLLGEVSINGETLGAFPTAPGGVQTIVRPPILVSPPTISSLDFGTVTLNGNVTSTNFSNVTERGFYYSTTNGFPDGSGTKVSSTGTFSAGAFSQVVSSLPAGTTYYFKSFATNAAGTTYSTQGSFITPKNAPQNAVTGFACGTTGAFLIPLTWTDAIGSPLPDGYLIRWSTVSYAAIANPTDGVPVGNGATNLNVAYGLQAANISNLNYNTTYYFKIFGYSNSGTNIRYRTATFGQTSCSTLSGIIENFEAGSKSTYTNEDINCTLGSWNFNNALLGTSTNDLKAGLQSARLQSGGSITMNFDQMAGLGVVSLKHARYNGASPSGLTFEYSTNEGSSWSNLGSFSNPSGLNTTSYTPNINRPGRLRIRHTSGSGLCNVDDVTIVPYCSPPATTSSLGVSNISSTGCDVDWGSASGSGTMLVLRPFSSANALPVLNSTYTPNIDWASAGQIDVNNRVVFRASGSSASGITGLSAESQYLVTAYNYNSTLQCYQLENPASASFWTYSLEPSAHPATFSAAGYNDDQITLNFSAANTLSNADGYLILMKAGSAPTGLPMDGSSYSIGDQIGDGIVVQRINSNSQTTTSITGLNSETTYHFSLIPYNWNGSNASTYNYRTAATILQANATTIKPASALSDILIDPNFSYNSNIPIINFQASNANVLATSVAVFKLIVRDGGGNVDDDEFPTILKKLRIAFSKSDLIRSIGLFGGSSQTTYITHLASGSSSVQFDNLDAHGALVTAPDGGTVEITVRVTFKASIEDNSQIVFSVEGADCEAFPTSSSQLFAFTKENSSIYQDRNRLEITATTIDYRVQPKAGEVGLALRPFEIVAEDALGNVDFDVNTCQVALTKGTGFGTMTAPGSPYTFTNGSIWVSDVSFSSATTYTIVATAQSCLGNNAKTSNSFAVTAITYVTGDFRSNGAVWTTLAHWQVRSGGTWIAATSFPTTTSRVYIQTAMSIAANTSVAEIIVLSGGTLIVNAEIGASSLVRVKSGGNLALNANLVTQASTDFILENGSNLLINYSCNNLSTLWTGTEDFQETSTVTIRNWDVSASPSSSRVLYNGSNISQNGRNLFGNLFIDLTSNLGNTLYLYDDNDNNYFTAGTLTIKSTNASQRVSLCSSSGGDLVQLRGNLIVDALYATTGNFQFAGSGSNRIIIQGNLALNAGNTLLKSSTSGADTIDVFGNMTIGANSNLIFNEVGSSNTLVYLKLKGDLSVNASGNIRNGSSTQGVGNYRLIFNGIGDGSTAAKTQEVSIASTSTTLENVNVRFECDPGSYVKLINQDLQLGQNSQVYLENNSVFDFGFNGSNVPLLVSESGVATGTSFTATGNTILKITSATGLATSGLSGNIQTDIRSFASGITFWYIGKANQNTGNVISTLSGAKNLVCDLETNSLNLNASANIDIPYRSFVEVRSGRLIESTTGTISGEGHISMIGGTFASTLANSVFPNLSDFDRFYISYGTFELAATGSQTLNFMPSSFAGLVVSGTGTKTLSESIQLSKLTITNGTLSPGANNISGENLTMTGGTLLFTKSGATPLPDFDKVYDLTGGSIEFDGSDDQTSQIIRTINEDADPIEYFNLNLNAQEANAETHNIEPNGNLIVNGTCTVKKPTVLFLDFNKKVIGTGNFVLQAGATLKLAEKNGLTPNACGTGISCGQVITTTRSFSSRASYWYTGNQSASITGTGLPDSVETLIINRQGSDIALSKNVFIRNLYRNNDLGMLTTGAFKVTLSDTAEVNEQDLAHIRGELQTTRNLDLTSNNFGGLGLTIDADGNSPGSTLVKRFTGSTVGNGINEAIRQKFVITPTVNTGLNATLSMHYFESEIHTLDENNFVMYRSTDGGLTWTEQSGCTLFPDEDYVSKSGIPAFSEWTLGDVNVPLPLSLLSFEGRLENGNAVLSWQTENEKDLNHFELYRSTNGHRFEKMADIMPSGNGRNSIYSHLDKELTESYFYKLVLKEKEVGESHSKWVFVDCECGSRLSISLFPNPGSGKVHLMANQSLENEEVFEIKLTSVDGKVWFQNHASLPLLESMLNGQLEAFPRGIYSFQIYNPRINQTFMISRQ